jgi:hypothetical protein
MFTVRRLGVGGRLATSLTNTNCIENMLSIARDTTRNVKRWRRQDERQVMGQQPPGAAGPQPGGQGVDQLAAVMEGGGHRAWAPG